MQITTTKSKTVYVSVPKLSAAMKSNDTCDSTELQLQLTERTWCPLPNSTHTSRAPLIRSQDQNAAGCVENGVDTDSRMSDFQLTDLATVLLTADVLHSSLQRRLFNQIATPPHLLADLIFFFFCEICCVLYITTNTKLFGYYNCMTILTMQILKSQKTCSNENKHM